MARQVINNGESGAIVRSKLNSNFTELYTDVAAPVLASEVVNTPSGTILSTNVQGAVNELDGDIQNINDNFAASVRGNVEDMLNAGAGITIVPSGSGATRELTINGSGGGASLAQIAPLLPLAGAFVANAADATALTVQAQVADRISLAPLAFPRDTTIDQVGISVSTLGAGVNARVLIYEADDFGRPTNLLVQSANISCAATGTVFATLAPTFAFLKNKMYWVGAHISGVATLRSIGIGGTPALSWSNAATPVVSRTLIKVVTYGSAPNPYGTFENSQLSAFNPPLILFRIA